MSVVLVVTRGLSSTPGISGITGSEPVSITTVSARIRRTSAPARTSTSRDPTNVARPVTMVTVSITSSMSKFLARSSAVRSALRVTARAYQCFGASPDRRDSASWTSALVGTHPMLMHVPPYI
ncbi:hypothetical protein D3C74_338530 [compost metagenome]